MIFCLYLIILGIILLSSIYVSGTKNKKGFCNYYFADSISTLAVDHEAINKILAEKAKIENRFLRRKLRFSGFTDAEGNFLIIIDRNYVKLRFKISLHIDDLKTLQVIQSNLNIGRVTEEKNMNRCSFIVEDISGITTICSIFNKYPLHTSKKLDFDSFYEAYLIKIKKKSKSIWCSCCCAS